MLNDSTTDDWTKRCFKSPQSIGNLWKEMVESLGEMPHFEEISSVGCEHDESDEDTEIQLRKKLG